MRRAHSLYATFGICVAGLFVLAGATGAEPVEAAGAEPVEEGTFFPHVRPGIDDSPSLPVGDSLPPADERLKALFAKSGVQYPPAAVVFAAFKEEMALDLYAKNRRGPWVLIHRYKIWAASGIAGPKLLEGDLQVPEGLYKVTWVRKESSFHRALMLNYPNAFDRKMAAAEKRKDLGGDIEIHGGSGSTGCLAMGDPSIDELYELVKKIGQRKVTVVIAPFDMRLEADKELPDEPEWTNTLYETIRAQLSELPPAPQDKSVVEAKE